MEDQGEAKRAEEVPLLDSTAEDGEVAYLDGTEPPFFLEMKSEALQRWGTISGGDLASCTVV